LSSARTYDGRLPDDRLRNVDFAEDVGFGRESRSNRGWNGRIEDRDHKLTR